MEILKINNLDFTYPGCDKKSLCDICFSVKRGELILICGASGSGKTTLLRMIKPELSPLGEKSGEILFDGEKIENITGRISASKIGYVMQNPEQQIVTDKVWHELAFGLENIGLPQDVISSRIAETASFFGIEKYFESDTAYLSGGQKQLLNLAAVTVMQPELLILDEPTAQLDPISAERFISSVIKLNRDSGMTVIISEHRTEELLPFCDKVLMLENGKIVLHGKTSDVIRKIPPESRMFCGVPTPARVFSMLRDNFSESENIQCPLTVREGRNYLNYFKNDIDSVPSDEYIHDNDTALEFKDVYFRYEKNLADVLKGTSFKIYKDEIFCILGGNGTGKSTALSAAAGLLKIYSGVIKIFGRKLKDYPNNSLYRECLAMLPQDVQTVFLRNTVREEFLSVGADSKIIPYETESLLDKHPYDLSGGEQQIAALIKVLASKPRLLLLDEPTKGLDSYSKMIISDILRSLKNNGMTILIVTHDAEFAASAADRCALFFNGGIVSCGTPREFFSKNKFYTTAASRMSGDYYPYAVTAEDIVDLCRLNGRKLQNESDKK